MYADRQTEAMKKAIEETNRRRSLQIKYNKEHGITPKPLQKKISDVNDMIIRNEKGSGNEISSQNSAQNFRYGFSADLPDNIPEGADEIKKLIEELSEKMSAAAKQLQFELAARLRDEINDLKKELKNISRH